VSPAEFLARFVVETDYQTGGGCTAWHLPMPGRFSVLITMHDYPEQPEASTDLVDVGLYDPDGDEHELRERVSLELAAAIVTDWLAKVGSLAKLRDELRADLEGSANVAEMRARIDRASGNLEELLKLKREWVGHGDILPTDGTAEVEAFLREWLEVVQQ
jgi:hypothetical protein